MLRYFRIIIFAVTVALITGLTVQTGVFAQTKRYNFILEGSLHESYPLAKGGFLYIDNVNGDIRIESWDKEEVDIEVRESGRGDDEIEIEIFVRSKGIEIVTHYPESRRNRRRSKAHYTLRVPKQVEIDAKTINGDVEVSGISGPVEAQTTNGDVVTTSIIGNLRASTTNGNIEIRDVEGRVTARTVNQSIELRDVKSSDIKASTVNGSIRADFITGDRGVYDFSTMNGSVTVYIPEDSKLDVEVRCRSRQFRSDFDIGDRDDRRRNWQMLRTYRGDINGGGGSLTIRTMNGRVNLRAR